MKFTDLQDTVLPMVLGGLAAAASGYVFIAHDDSPLSLRIVISLLFLLLALVLIVIINVWQKRSDFSTSHTVGIVGLPRSGKTTLIVGSWAESFSRNVWTRITPRGTNVIERVNEYLALLDNGRAIGPTTDQDRFSFRADVSLDRLFFKRRYKLEIGDFPGEDSKKYFEEYGPWLHRTEFFKWVIEADAVAFVVDIAEYMIRREQYVNEISASIRAAWQHLADARKTFFRDRSLPNAALVFAKADLLEHASAADGSRLAQDSLAEKIRSIAFSDTVPAKHDLSERVLRDSEQEVLRDFSNLISYFQSEDAKFNYVFTSVFGTLQGKRLGISRFLDLVLPD